MSRGGEVALGFTCKTGAVQDKRLGVFFNSLR